MLGLKAASTRHKGRRPDDTAKPKDIPGFSKWITSEVYIEDKIAESSLEQLAMNMIENIEWINEAIHDVTSNVTGISLSDEEVDEEVKTDLENKDFNDEDHHSENSDKDQHGRKEGKRSEDILLRTADNSILLLKSPRRIREQKSSPIQQIRRREIELIKDTTALILDSKDHDTSVRNAERKETIMRREVEIKMEEADAMDEPMLNLEDSFELISRDIRKSFAAKQKTTAMQEHGAEKQEAHGKEEVFEYDEEPYKDICRDAAVTNAANTKSSLKKSSSAEPLPNPKMKSPEDEIKELSRLIDGVNDDLLSDAEDEDLSIELDKLEKIELSQLKRKPTLQEYKSPIKFSEMPMIEPLTLESSRKKSMRKTLDQQKQLLSARKSNSHRSSNTQMTTIFDEDVGKRRRESHNFQLNPLPNEMFSVGNTSVDEPTIKLDRNFTKSFQTGKSPENSLKRVQSTESGKHDFISRLMQPTEAGKQRIRESSFSPKKAQKTSIKSSPKVGSQITPPARDEDEDLRHKSEKKMREVSMVPSALKILEAPKEASDIARSTSPIKRQVPLTKKSLKSSANYEQLYGGKKLEGDADVASGRFYQETLGLSKKRVVGDSKIPTASSISERRRLKSMSKGSSRLNYQTEPTGSTKNAKALEHTKDTRKGATGGNENKNILPDVIPCIPSENEAADDERDERDLDAGRSSAGAGDDWTSEKSILRQLKLQLKTNPGPIFGPISAVDCDKLFGKKFGPGMNITWDSKDRLGATETDAYERAMGWK
ncbi:hypothetical protein PMKS-002627 [Pichia membranifaciens]|uniref:Inner centromere protein ARK-binding domain-containing protein n=1 Tax=Pichia membranifaciens TaxID=4926 RepID=A0A1Q2YHY4_9ASCO|nr:hypothetical protein PMKS-002627 [Pichia membranifaciens]